MKLKQHQQMEHADFFEALKFTDSGKVESNLDEQQLKILLKMHGYDVYCKRFYNYEAHLRSHL